MALFFDTDWFDAALARAGRTRSDLAAALGLSERDLADVWKDQRELSARDVAAIAAFLGAPPEEVADRAGISTPVPKVAPADAAQTASAIAELGERLARIERTLGEIKALLLDLRRTP